MTARGTADLEAASSDRRRGSPSSDVSHVDETDDAVAVQLIEVNGAALAFVETGQGSTARLRYKVRPADGDWSPYVNVPFPDEIRGNGLALVTTTMATAGFVKGMPGHWRVIVDEGAIVLFRADEVFGQPQLLANRYLLLPSPNSEAKGGPEQLLVCQPEARFERSGVREVPADDDDRPSYRRPDGSPFIEPTIALPGVTTCGWFTVVLTPSSEPSRRRWVFFTHDPSASSLLIDSFPVNDQGWPDSAGARRSRARLPKHIQSLEGKPTATTFRRQEYGDDGTALPTGARVAIASEVRLRPAADAPQNDTDLSPLICVDFALDSTGHPIVEVDEDDVLMLPSVEPAPYALRFRSAEGGVNIPRTLKATPGDFAIEFWVRNQGTDPAVLLQRLDASGAPALEVRWEDAKIATRLVFNAGTTTPSASEVDSERSEPPTPDALEPRAITWEAHAPSDSNWHHLALTWRHNSIASRYEFEIFIDGVLAANTTVDPGPDVALSLAATGPAMFGGVVPIEGSRPNGRALQDSLPEPLLPTGLTGSLAELRWWSVALDEEQIDRFMYRRLTVAQRGDAPLLGYWPLSEPGQTAGAAKDESSYENDAVVIDADWVTDTPPIGVGLPELGLSSGMGVLGSFTDGATGPELLDGADGLLHLYFERNHTLTSAHYDTRIARATYTVPSSDSELHFAAHEPGPAMNRGPEVDGEIQPVVDVTSSAEDGFVCVKLKSPDAIGVHEVFEHVPDLVGPFRQVLNGSASPDPLRADVRNGAVVFYDYTGTRPAVEIATESNANSVVSPIALVTARSDEFPSALNITTAEVAAGEAGDVTVGFAAPDIELTIGDKVHVVKRTIEPTLRFAGIGASTDALRAALAGRAAPPSLLAGNLAELATSQSPVGFVFAGGTTGTVKVTDTGPSTVNVTISAKSGEADSRATWTSVPTESTRCIATLNGLMPGYSYTAAQAAVMKSFVVVGANNGPITSGQTTTSASDAQTVTSIASFLNSIDHDVGPDLTIGNHAAPARRGATRTVAGKTQQPFASALFQVLPVPDPLDGTSPRVATSHGVLRRPGNFGGWIPAPPVTTGTAKNGAPTATGDGSGPLRKVEDFTIEGWVRPKFEGRDRQQLLNARGDDPHGLMLGLVTDRKRACLFESTGSPTQFIGTNTRSSCLSFWFHPNGLSNESLPIASFAGVGLLGASHEVALSRHDDKLTFHTRLIIAGTSSATSVEFGTRLRDEWTYVVWSLDWRTFQASLQLISISGEITTENVAMANSALPALLREQQWMLLGRDLLPPAASSRNLGSFAGVAAWSSPLTKSQALLASVGAFALDDPKLDGSFDIGTFDGQPVPNDAASNGAGPLTLSADSQAEGSKPGPIICQPFAALNERVLLAAKSVPPDSWTHIAATGADTVGAVFDGSGGALVADSDDLDFGTAMGIDCWITADESATERSLLDKSGAKTDALGYRLRLTKANEVAFQIQLSDGRLFSWHDASVTVMPGVPTYIAASARIIEANDSLTGDFDLQSKKDGDNERGSITSTTKYRSNLVITLAAYRQGDSSVMQATSPTLQIYESTEVKTFTFAESGAPVSIGQAGPSGNGPSESPAMPFLGTISEMRLWSRAIGDSVTELAFSDAPAGEIAQGLEANWTFDEGSGSTVADSVASHTATLTKPLWGPSAASARLQLVIDGHPANALVVPAAQFANGGQANTTTLGGVLPPESIDGRTTHCFTGQFDDIRVWSAARTAEEIAGSRFVAPAESDPNLVAYWPIAAGNGTLIRDVTGNSNDLVGPETFWAEPDGNQSPVGIESPSFSSAIGGATTSVQVRDAATAASTIEHAVIKVDSDDRQRGLMNRQSAYITKGEQRGKLVFTEDFPVGEVDLAFVGQAQTEPTLIGYIEGAPPVPSENLTRPYWIGPNKYQEYLDVTQVTLTDSDETTYRYTSSSNRGLALEESLEGGFGLKGDTDAEFAPLGFGIEAKAFEVQFKVGIRQSVSLRKGQLRGDSQASARSSNATNVAGISGDWAPANTDSDHERRYAPDNVGYALVRSSVADIFALRLARTGAMIGLITVPNEAIAPDENVIMFPMSDRYTRQGVLDGYVGFDVDPTIQRTDEGEASYFRPREAARLEVEIEAAESRAESTYKARRIAAPATDGSEFDAPSMLSEKGSWTDNLVNSYVWTAAGGLRIESSGAMDTRTESSGGSYNLTWLLGVGAQFELLSPGGGLYIDGSVLAGEHIDTEIGKERDESRSIALQVTNECESFLARWSPDGSTVEDGSAVPGKVTAYRFKTFYLGAQEQWFDEFFDTVVDPNWLASSDDPNAIALRWAKSQPNRLWRVMHRVTYVERVPPTLDRVPAETVSKPAMPVIDARQNDVLTSLVAHAMASLPAALPLREKVAQALEAVLSKDGGVARELPWWSQVIGREPDRKRIHRLALRYLVPFFTNRLATAPSASIDLTSPDQAGDVSAVDLRAQSSRA